MIAMNEEGDFPPSSIEEIDNDLTAAYTMAVNAHWPSTAIACALLDKGILRKNDLLAIIDSLILTASSFAVTAEASPDAATGTLERFRRDLEQMTLAPGQVVDELRRLEKSTGDEAERYQGMLRRSQPPASDKET